MADFGFVQGTLSKSDGEVIDLTKKIEFPTVRETLEIWGAKLVTDLQRSASQHKASGALEASIEFNVEFDGQFLNFELSLNDYYKYIDLGVKGSKTTYSSSANSPFKYTTKMPPLQAIAQWVGNKGIVGRTVHTTATGKPYYKTKKLSAVSEGQKTVRAIQRSIFFKGIEATGFYSNVVNTGRIEDLRKQLIDGFGKDLIANL
jgi:hypothetical protein